MIKKWWQRRKLAQEWESVLGAVAILQQREGPEAVRASEAFIKVCSKTMRIYPENRVSKRILRAMVFLKRVLADKAMYDHVKVIEYITAGHNASKKFKGEVRDTVIAHFWNLASTYCSIIIKKEYSNPLVPGEILNPSRMKEEE